MGADPVSPAERVSTAGPGPGAGTIAAGLGALAAGLLAEVARSSADWQEAAGTAAQAESLRRRLDSLADRNSAAYAAALATLEGAGARGDGERDDSIAAAMGLAVTVLTAIAEASGDLVELARELAPGVRPDLRPDVLSAALFGNAAAGAAVALIEANLLASAAEESLERARAAAARARTALERDLAVSGGSRP